MNMETLIRDADEKIAKREAVFAEMLEALKEAALEVHDAGGYSVLLDSTWLENALATIAKAESLS